jgi:hypothetical protein
MFALIVGFSALLVAGCAAYFSVQGLASLYAGAFFMVCIMAGSLEFGKLVAASYLHRYWNETKFLLKTYLIVAVLTLMGITSLGIFGFLTSAYQQSHVKIEILDTKRMSIETKKESHLNELSNLNKRIETLNQVRVVQEQRVQDAGNYRLPREQAYAAIQNANNEINQSQEKIKQLNFELENINNELILLKTEETKSTDIGTLKFVASLFNVNIETIVKWFTFIIVLVFDPLAVCLVLAYNNIVLKKNKTKSEQEEVEEKIIPKIIETSNLFQKVPTPERVKYQDK